MSEEVRVKVTKNGPIFIEGPAVIQDLSCGCKKPKETVIEEGRNIKVCRCGMSQDKPWCDGSHRTNKFDDTQ